MKLSNSSENKVGIVKLSLWQSSAVSRTITVLVLGYLMIYCTDTLHVPAAGVSLILVFSKFIDGFTDAIAGFIVDKTKTRFGTGRPYEVFIVFLWLATWLLYSCPPSFSTIAKYIWIFCMYVLANAVCTTFLIANVTPYAVRAFKHGQIVKVTSYGSIYTMLVAIAFNVIFPSMMQAAAGSPSAWSRMVGMMAVPLAAIGLLRMIFIKEQYEVGSSTTKKEGIKFSDAITVLKSNPYIFLIALMTLVFNFVTNMGVNSYYFTYIVGNLGLMGVMSAITIVTIPVPFLFPKLIRKFSVFRLMQFGFILSGLGGLVNFFAGANMPLLMVGSLLGGIGTVPASMLTALIVIQCADFNEWNGNQRMEGTMSSVIGLAGKIGAAVGAGALGVILQFSGYTGVAETMPGSAYLVIRLLYSLVPMALYFITALTLRRYKKLEDMTPQIKADNEARRNAASDAVSE
ncbi:MAG: MFS transporter [Eubacteriales bacterium]|nr:MFS transporter [Eubacteriales bacterium]